MASVYAMTQHRRRFGGEFRSHLAELQAHAHRTAEENLSDQLQRLRSALSYAGEHCPYYRELFKTARLEPDAIRSLSDLRCLPLLDKETVRSQADRLLAHPLPRDVISGYTSGTTGTPLRLFFTEEANQRHYATQWFHKSWAGIKRGDRWALFGGQPVALQDDFRPPFWVRDWFENEMIFSCIHITPGTLSAYARALARFRPAAICGIPSAIHLVALHVLETGRDDIRPKGVFTWAETTLEYQRRAIEQAFNCRVYSSYGNGERTGHLLQCEHGNFHVVPETCVAEVLDSNGDPTRPGEIGELVCTSLVERAMPLIRYRMGDAAVAAGEGLCSCGRTTPIVRDVSGRTHLYVIGRNGLRYGPLPHLFDRAMQIKEAQFVQDEPGRVCIRVVPRAGYGAADHEILMKAAREKFRDQVDVTIQVVDAIERTAGGKFPVLVSTREHNQRD